MLQTCVCVLCVRACVCVHMSVLWTIRARTIGASARGEIAFIQVRIITLHDIVFTLYIKNDEV